MLAGPLQSEKTLGAKRIDECFDKSFFQTKFWYMWDTIAVEFRRYVHRFIQEFPRINTLAGVDRTPYNQYDYIIRPIEIYLKAQGVDFHYETKVTSLSSFHGSNYCKRNPFYILKTAATGLIHVELHDIVMVILGSMTACSSIGTNNSPPKALPIPDVAKTAPDGS
ncbi:Oleate hydratase [Lachnellula cervina]|uniref:Oleate hydratase n=1 Tax=Lachnellula cervina TaxID=1316786 RepID=A0A7D8YPR6_9HELO|nr:Oleate hydratase [Lachnellula cervina]